MSYRALITERNTLHPPNSPLLTQLCLDIETVPLLPGFVEPHTVGVRGQVLMFFHLSQLLLAIPLPTKPLSGLLDCIQSPVFSRAYLVDHTKRALTKPLQHFKALLKVGHRRLSIVEWTSQFYMRGSV